MGRGDFSRPIRRLKPPLPNIDSYSFFLLSHRGEAKGEGVKWERELKDF
jgi:hypothetical protein